MSAEKPLSDKAAPNSIVRSTLNMLLTIALILILLISVFVTAYLVVSHPRGELFTEFYILGNNGKADNYPQYVEFGQLQTVIAGVVNHEDRNMDYDLVVMFDDGLHKNQLYAQRLMLADNDTWQKAITVKPMTYGTQLKLDFLLYADGNMTAPYRECYLYINVDKPDDTSTNLDHIQVKKLKLEQDQHVELANPYYIAADASNVESKKQILEQE